MLINIKKAAAYLGLKEYTVRTLTRRNHIPHRFISGRYMYLQEELDEWIRDTKSEEEQNDKRLAEM
jgi:excisionase family DNA binding protein